MLFDVRTHPWCGNDCSFCSIDITQAWANDRFIADLAVCSHYDLCEQAVEKYVRHQQVIKDRIEKCRTEIGETNGSEDA